jgi:hypothetical protein
MAKAKKPEKGEAAATKKQATGTKSETKKAATPPAEASAKKTTKAAAAPKAAASADKQSSVGGAATRKKAQAKPAGSPSGVPLIDTSLAAETAAKFVMNRALLGNAAPAGGAGPAQPAEPAEDAQAAPEGAEKRETSTFKQLKAGLNKPAAGGLGGLLGNASVGKKGNTPFGGGNQQVGRNQTFGGDITRSGVPRRTGG